MVCDGQENVFEDNYFFLKNEMIYNKYIYVNDIFNVIK